MRAADARVAEVRAGVDRAVADALAQAKARSDADLRAVAAEVLVVQERARDALSHAAMEQDRQDGERARAVSLERLEWMKERQQGEEGEWVCHPLCPPCLWGHYQLAACVCCHSPSLNPSPRLHAAHRRQQPCGSARMRAHEVGMGIVWARGMGSGVRGAEATCCVESCEL